MIDRSCWVCILVFYFPNAARTRLVISDTRASSTGGLEVAEKVGIDITVLSRMIQRYTGCTFTQLFHTARFNKAVTLLRDTQLSVADIAVSIGYENPAFFYRRFSKIYGCIPGEFRKRHQN